MIVKDKKFTKFLLATLYKPPIQMFGWNPGVEMSCELLENRLDTEMTYMQLRKRHLLMQLFLFRQYHCINRWNTALLFSLIRMIFMSFFVRICAWWWSARMRAHLQLSELGSPQSPCPYPGAHISRAIYTHDSNSFIIYMGWGSSVYFSD